MSNDIGSALFVGGPLDGKRMMVGPGDRFYASMPRWQHVARDTARADDLILAETAVYLRTEVGARADPRQTYQYVLYVYGGVQNRHPRADDQIVFRGVLYKVAVVHFDGGVRCAAKRGDTSILVAEKDLRYYWPADYWEIRDGANVEVRVKYLETAP